MDPEEEMPHPCLLLYPGSVTMWFERLFEVLFGRQILQCSSQHCSLSEARPRKVQDAGV